MFPKDVFAALTSASTGCRVQFRLCLEQEHFTAEGVFTISKNSNK